MKSKYDFPRYTYNDYKNWKEDWEIIDGYPLQILSYSYLKHSRIKSRLIAQTCNTLKNNTEKRSQIFTNLDWIINSHTVVRPDLMIICGKPLIDYLEFPPVLIVEIISPSSVKKDRVIKFDLYREQGVKYYIMVDSSKETVEVFELIDNLYKQVDITTFQIDKNCEVTFDFDTIWK
jgi:Uma2 family endonuclease